MKKPLFLNYENTRSSADCPKFARVALPTFVVAATALLAGCEGPSKSGGTGSQQEFIVSNIAIAAAE